MPEDIKRIELQLHMKFVGDDHDGYVTGTLTKWDGVEWDHEWDADTFSEVIRDVFNELGHRLIKNTVKLTVTFEV